jgi:hypothetical protein
MSQQDLLRRVVAALDAAGIDYMITGSIASSLQGEPRLTHDLDVVVKITEKQVGELLKAFPVPQFYFDERSAREAIRTHGSFNVLEAAEGGKVDFWLLTQEDFDTSRFQRKYQEEIFGFSLKVSAPEDTILQKLRWAKMSGGSEKLFTDALRVYEVQALSLDRSYLDSWAARLGVRELWEKLLSQAEEI